MLRLKRAAQAAALVLIAGCTADAGKVLGPSDGPSRVISDAAHAGAVPGFYFLPPMVPQPSYSGTFDAGLTPRVEICALSGASCGATIATFAFGTGSSNVRVSAADQQYQVNWHTKDYNLNVATMYRISVYQGTFLLGFADVDVVGSGKDLKNVDTQQFIALLDDRTLPIKFRIETGIVREILVTPATAEVNVGGTQQFTATLIDLHGDTVTGPAVTWSSSAAAVATVDGSGLATGVAPGTATITASIGYVSGSATLTVVQPNLPPVANPDTFQAIGNVTVPVAAPGVLANDTDPDGDALGVVAGTVTTANGGTAILNADGSFTYLSAAGFTGTDSFDYQVTDGIETATGTVTIAVATRVWYVSNAGTAPGDGRDASPFVALKSAEAASAAGETIFLLAGDGSTTGYDEGIILKNGQSLTGQGIAADVTVTLNGQQVVLLDAGSAPTVTRTDAGTTVQLASGNTVQGLHVASSNGAGIAGSGFGTFTASAVSVGVLGGAALELQNGTVAASLGSVSSSNSAGAGLSLVGLSGSLSATGGAINGAAGAGVAISGGNAGIDYAGSISGSGAGAAVISGRTGGAVVLSGAISDTGNGIVVQNNTGGTVSFTGSSKSLSTGAANGVTLANNSGSAVVFGGGGLAIATTTGTGFSATGGGTVTVTGANNAIGAAGGTALRVENTTIGASGLTFRSISASGGANGIVLANTGAVNGLQVTGDGATAGSGGTIQGMSGDGVLLSDARNAELAYVTIQNNQGNGVHGSDVVNVRIENASVLNNGDNAAADEAGIRFDNLGGSSAIENTTVAGSVENNVRVVNTSGTLSLLAVIGSTFRDNSAATGTDGLRVAAAGTAEMTVSVQGSHFLRHRGTGVSAGTEGSGVLDLTVSGGSLVSNNVGVSIVHNSTGSLTFDVLNIGVITGHVSSPINVNRGLLASAGSTFSGTVSGNTIGTVGVTNSGATAGPGIRVVANGSGTTTVAATNNVIREVANRGIDVLAREGNGTLNATITGNSVALTSPLSGDGIRVDAGVLTTDQVKVCAVINGNTSSTVAGLNGIRVRQRFLGTTFQLAGYAGAPTNNAAVVAFLTSTNTVATASADNGGPGFTGVASCPQP